MSFGLATPPLSLPSGGIARTFFLDPSSSVLALPAGGDGSSLLQLHILKQGNICNTQAQIERLCHVLKGLFLTCASSSEKSLMLDSLDELTADDSCCRRASSDAYFFTYSETFFLYSSGLE